MNMLDSPLEALAVNYLSFGFLATVNSLWAWIAVITAAIRIWRLKAVGATAAVIHKFASPATGSYSICRSTTVLETLPPNSTSNLLSSAVRSVRPAPTTTSTRSSQQIVDGEHSGVLKGPKFRLYYFEENVEVEDELRVDNEWDDVVYGSGEWWEWWEWWDRALKMKKGEMGWYRHQDSTKLNGNIVKLWDGGKARER